ncbi:hypothetical protein N0V83_008111 [Neocucurbitaria cava]|uniref:Heterokaryon incompatibility domain-containing protein n=1 Tax=Neocucurbitaria cava TaxID=798079 RepID=A0A9W8Y629_9PLEO|nr:hypothetical protein N0V83_008111 [Neocucurbitaria cava]
MRLLNVKTRRLEEFHGDTIPSYAILSHTWGEEEVTFQDMTSEDHKQKHGYRKIEGCCQAAAEQRILYVWVDSCCIDKSSSAELSEAINSMFKWYEASKVCFIYLEDLPAGLDPFTLDSAFRRSRWWTRGWTLQELLAPHHIIYFDSTWERVFTSEMGQELFKKIDLPVRSEEVMDRTERRPGDRIQTIIEQIRYGLITEITGIPGAVLAKELELSEVSAACKFAWASQRMTTRIEDKAYCLMGLLGVNMPLLYGEGEKAFVRLQEAVISSSDDISLLAWGFGLAWEDIEELGYDKILASSPTAFREYPKSNHRCVRRPPKTHSTVTGHGLHIELPLLLISTTTRVWIGIIEEGSAGALGDSGTTALVLRQKNVQDTNIFERARGCPALRIPNFHSHKRVFRAPISKMVYLQDGGTASTAVPLEDNFDPPRLLLSYLTFMRKSINRHQYTSELAIFIKSFRNVGYTLSSRYPPIDPDMVSMFAREAHKWELSDGQIQSHYESPFEWLLCPGPGNERFYFILANTKGHCVAVKVQIRFKPPYIHSYQVELSHCNFERSATALEYACDTGLRTEAAKQFRKELRWNSYVNLWSSNTTKIHVSACPSQQRLSKKNVSFAQCSLVWSGGWVSAADQRDKPSE